MKQKTLCLNCQSRRRAIKKSCFCIKCYYWHRKKFVLQRKLNLIDFPKNKFPADTLRDEIRMAERILQEYRWREENLNQNDVEPMAVESLIYAIAGECRSEIGLVAQPLPVLLDKQTAKARKLMFSILLSIVENIPAAYPRLHTLMPPKRGSYFNPWMEWANERHRLPIRN